MSIQKMYNPLINFMRKVIMKMNKLPRDILLIILTVILTAFGAIVPSLIKTKWSIVTIIWYSLIIISLLLLIWTTARSIQKIDEKEALNQKRDNQKLIEDTVKATIKAFKDEKEIQSNKSHTTQKK